jgi:hypothetical protein
VRLLEAGLVVLTRHVGRDVCVVEEVDALAPEVRRHTRTLHEAGVEELLGDISGVGRIRFVGGRRPTRLTGPGRYSSLNVADTPDNGGR